MNNTSCLLIFVKNPELGKVKTRLARTLGDTKALAIYNLLLKKTQQITEQLESDKVVYYSSMLNNDDLWSEKYYTKKLQKGDSLGERMSIAFQESFKKGYQRIIIIGSDCYDLSESILELAFQKLDQKDVVIGPANDGGYYLLGMNQYMPEIFENKSWSESSLLNETILTIKQLEKTYFLLEELADIDTEQDLIDCGLSEWTQA